MSTPVASRRWTVRTRTKPDSGAVESHSCLLAEVVDRRRRRSPGHAGEAAGGVVGEVPVADLAGRLVEAHRERRLLDRTGGERRRLVEGVAETGVDVPGALGVVVGGQAGHGQHEVVGHLLLGGADRAVHATDVAGHVVAERLEQHAEGAVEVEAVAAPPHVGDAGHRLVEVDAPALAGVDPQRLVRHLLHLGAVEADQRVGRRRLRVEPEPREVRRPVVGAHRSHAGTLRSDDAPPFMP